MASLPAVGTGVRFIELTGKGLEASAQTIQNVQVIPMSEGSSHFIKPQSVLFRHNNQNRRWDMVSSHPSVSVILYHKELEALLLVRQFRPAVYATAVAAAAMAFVTQSDEQDLLDGTTLVHSTQVPITAGFTYELCAGLVDKPGKDLLQIAKEEVREEVGYDISREDIKPVSTCAAAVGINGSLQTYFYAEVTESQRVSDGGGNSEEAEDIDVVALPVSQLDNFVTESSIPKPCGAIFAAMWLKQHLKI